MFFAVIDEKQKESLPKHETQLSSIRWHLSEGLFLFWTFYVNLGRLCWFCDIIKGGAHEVIFSFV